MNDEKILIEEELVQEEIPQEETSEETLPQEEATEELIPQEELPEETLPQEEETEELIPQEESPENPEEEFVSEEATDEQIAAEEQIDPREEIMKKAPYHERYYLQYCGGKRCSELDLEGTKNFLQEMGFDGGELRQARKGKDQAKVFQSFDQNKKNQMYCSYCGAEIAGIEYFRLPDGRLRCTTCSRTIVTDKEEVQEICKRVISNMDSFFGATIDVPVSIEVLDERKLKKKIGVPLGTKDSQSMLVLGVAINKKKKFSILLENGAPRLSLIATFAHELTHIWQYTHWDNNKKLKKCPKSNHLLIYEGMAKWAEIQYLYLIGETNVAKREEYITRNRQDEYGIGFCLYEDYYPLSREAMTCQDTPFTPNSYPFN